MQRRKPKQQTGSAQPKDTASSTKMRNHLAMLLAPDPFRIQGFYRRVYEDDTQGLWSPRGLRGRVLGRSAFRNTEFEGSAIAA